MPGIEFKVSGLKATGIFVILLSQTTGFESDSPEQKLKTTTS